MTTAIEVKERSKTLPVVAGESSHEIRIDGKIAKIITISEDGVMTGKSLTPWSDIFAAAIDGNDDLSRVYLAIAREGIRRDLVDTPSLSYEWDGDQVAGRIQSILQAGDVTIAYGPSHRLGTISGPEIVATSPLKKLWALFR